jgi:hypothetical protein
MPRISKKKVPAELRQLIPFAQRFGARDGMVRERLCAEASKEELSALATLVEGHEQILIGWLERLDPHSEEFTAFAGLRDCSMTGVLGLLLRLHEHAPGRLTKRKLRLFAVACCYRIWHLIPDPRSKCGVEFVERYADGLATVGDLDMARRSMPHSSCALAEPVYLRARDADSAAHCTVVPDDQFDFFMAQTVAESAAKAVAHSALGDAAVMDQARLVEEYQQTRLLRDIFSNPFQPVSLDRAWFSRKVKTLAQAIYDERAFERMPELADALAEAGCSNQDILSHCRGPGPHIRGCWVVDLVLDWFSARRAQR